MRQGVYQPEILAKGITPVDWPGYLTQQLEAQQKKNQQAQLANDRLAAEVRDLKEGLEMVEEKARQELGMVRPNEIYVHLAR